MPSGSTGIDLRKGHNHLTKGEGPPRASSIEEIRAAGSAAASAGLTAREAVDLYLSTAARAWGSMAHGDLGLLSAGHTLLDAIRLDIPLSVEGYRRAGQDLIRQEETARLEFISTPRRRMRVRSAPLREGA